MIEGLNPAPTTIPFGPRWIDDPLLLRAAVGESKKAPEAWQAWKEATPQAEAPEVLLWAGGYVAANLREAGSEDAYLEGIRRYNLLRNAKTVSALRPVVTVLANRRPLVPLKGGALSITGDVRGQRPFADLDLYLAPDEMGPVASELLAAGFEPLEGLSIDELLCRVVPRRSSWSFLDEQGRDLDLHWRVLEHLNLEASRSFVEAHITMRPTALGELGMLCDEAQAMVLLMHHMAEDPHAPHSLYDLVVLLRRSEASLLWEVADEAELGAWLAGTLDRVEEVLEHQVVQRPAVTPRSMPWPKSYTTSPFEIDGSRRASGQSVRRRWNPEIQERSEKNRWNRRFAAWVVRRSGSARFERLLRNLGEPLSEGIPAWGCELDFSGCPALGRSLGPGWNIQYPEHEFRWTDSADARVLLVWPGGERAMFEIDVDAQAWEQSRLRYVEIVANGTVLGSFPEDRDRARFEVLRPRDGIVEISLRPQTRSKWVELGPGTHPYRFGLPVRRLALKEIDARRRRTFMPDC